MKRLLFYLILASVALITLGICPHHPIPNWPKDYNPPMLSVGVIIEVFDTGGELEGIVLIQREKKTPW